MLSFWRPRASLPLSTHSLAVCLMSALRCFRKSVPSPALFLIRSRVSCPDFGAKSIPIPTPTPSPSKKLESPFLSICCLQIGTTRKIEKVQPVRLTSSILPMSKRIMKERRARPLDAATLWEYALKSLAGRAQSTGELREKLRRRAERVEDVDGVLSRLKQSGYLDDKRYAESFAATRLSGEKFGRGRVIRDLRQHRVAPVLAESTVEKVYRDVDEEALIEEWIRRKYRTAAREGLFGDRKDK